jgi:hypothetical protein
MHAFQKCAVSIFRAEEICWDSEGLYMVEECERANQDRVRYRFS